MFVPTSELSDAVPTSSIGVSTGPSCTENVCSADDVLSSFDVAVTVTSTELMALPSGVRTKSPLPSNDAVSFVGSETLTVYDNKSDSGTSSTFSNFAKSSGWTRPSGSTFHSGREGSAVLS